MKDLVTEIAKMVLPALLSSICVLKVWHEDFCLVPSGFKASA